MANGHRADRRISKKNHPILTKFGTYLG